MRSMLMGTCELCSPVLVARTTRWSKDSGECGETMNRVGLVHRQLVMDKCKGQPNDQSLTV